MKKPIRPKPVLDLPSPDEANAAAAVFSEATAPTEKNAKATKAKSAPPKEQARPNLKPKLADLPPDSEDSSKAVGRPRANHGRRSTSVMVKPFIWKQLKLVALQNDIDLSEMLETMFVEFLTKNKAL